jgi:hypothetical protein
MLVTIALLLSLNAASAAFLSGAGVAVRRGSSPAISTLSGIAMVAKQTPHGGRLIDLFVEDKDAAKAGAEITIELNDRQSCDVELLCNGGFSPLTGFMNEDEYNSVVQDMKLPSGLIFGLPVVMDTANPNVKVGSKLLLTYKVRRAPRRPRCDCAVGGAWGQCTFAPARVPCAHSPCPPMCAHGAHCVLAHPVAGNQHGRDDGRVGVGAGQAEGVPVVLRHRFD